MIPVRDMSYLKAECLWGGYAINLLHLIRENTVKITIIEGGDND
jgi:hypothetical protein